MNVLGGRYELGDIIGQGSTVTVYRGRDMRMGERAIAIKVMQEAFNSDPKAVARFQWEAKVASPLQHPNIVQVYDYGQSDGNYFIVMELVDGADLRRYLRARGMLAVDRTIIIAHDVALGLGAAHRRSIVHRNVKPQHILIGRDGSIKLSDFGIASTYKDVNAERHTAPGIAVGTVQYYAPEQAQGKIVNPAADVYALGIVMYEMLTARLPFNGNTAMEIAMEHILTIPAPPSAFNPNIPSALEEIIMRCLEKDPQKRYRDGSTLARMLEMLGEVEEEERSPGGGSPALVQAPTIMQRHVQQPEPPGPNEQLMQLLTSTQLPANTVLKGRYHIINRLGKGGMGAVYKAKDTTFNNRFVAVKQMIQIGLAPQMLMVYTDNFRREADLLAGLMHPNLPRIYEHFSEDECWYLVMDFIDGINVQKHLALTGGHLSIEESLRIGIDLCTVLGHLHSQQPPIVFRDLKPANVMITPGGHLYLIDFGIARQFKPEQLQDTHNFQTMGYAAPEQFNKKQTTPQSDIYSLGATLHQLLSGNDPSDTPFDLPPLQVGVPALATLVSQMLQMKPANRPASMAVVKQALQRILAQVQSDAKPVLPPANPLATPLFVPDRLGYLRTVEGKEPGRIYELRKELTSIGRSRESDIFLEDIPVSRVHASIIRQQDGQYAVEDKGSANGTKLNGQQLDKFRPYALQEGDRIQAGTCVLVFTFVNGRSPLAESFVL